MFDELPASIPHKNKKKLKAIAGAAVIQAALVAAIIIIQMAVPEKLGEFQLLQTLYMAPPPPPPAVSAAPQPVRSKPVKAVSEATRESEAAVQPRPVEEPKVVAPTTIPNDIARIIESGPPSQPAAAGGVPGGVAGGVTGGVFGGMLGGAAIPHVAPPPPNAPVRVGGNVKQPKVLHIEQPHYPIAAKQAHIEGVVVVEATVTADGSVEKVKVISGPAQLQQAAADAVSHWRYEPTYLNGKAVPVILTARITFSLSGSQQ